MNLKLWGVFKLNPPYSRYAHSFCYFYPTRMSYIQKIVIENKVSRVE